MYEQEIGGEGAHSYVLMFLCSLQDSGLTIFPTHRLLKGLDENKRAALRGTIEQHFDVSEMSADELEPPADGGPVAFGYLDSFHKRPLRLTLKDQAAADEALAGRSDAYRRLDTAVLEALILKGALGMTEDDVANKRGLGYSKDFADARDAVESGRADAAFFMRATPVEQVREVAGGGRVDAAEVDLLLPEDPHRARLQPARLMVRQDPPSPGPPPLRGQAWRHEDLHPQGRRRHHGPLVRRPRVEGGRPARGLRRRGRGGERTRAVPRRVCDDEEVHADILRIQTELFVAGAELATAPEAAHRLEPGVSKVTQEMVDRLEGDIDRYMDRVDLPPKFVIPGGTELSARLDVARTAIRPRRAQGG